MRKPETAEEVLQATYIATLAEACAVVLFISMIAVWLAIWSGA